MKGKPVKISFQDRDMPYCIPTPRSVAFPFLPEVKAELNLKCMEDARVIFKVSQPTDRCAPMVTVPKKKYLHMC